MTPFTGERIHADDEDFRLDVGQHLAAYNACLPFVTGKVVLDAGCGDARATSRLARSARLVIGMDNSWEAVRGGPGDHPRNLLLSCGDVRALAFRDASFDVVCCFQVLEHLPAPVAFLEDVTRVLRAGGLLVLTTPNRLTSFSENPYHVKEYRGEELLRLVEPLFSSVEILGVFGNERVRMLQSARRRRVRAILGLDPLGLRRALPLAAQKRAFAILARWVRARVRSALPDSFERVADSDYSVTGGDVAESLDLLALCRR